MDLAIQPKLLKALEEKTFRRLGAVRDRQVDIRLIASTNLDLEALVRSKTFRDDLYYRVSTLTLLIPPLRERREDIPILARAILRSICSRVGKAEIRLEPEAEAALCAYAWPGNIRELANVLERAMILQRGERLLPEDLGLGAQAHRGGRAERRDAVAARPRACPHLAGAAPHEPERRRSRGDARRRAADPLRPHQGARHRAAASDRAPPKPRACPCGIPTTPRAGIPHRGRRTASTLARDVSFMQSDALAERGRAGTVLPMRCEPWRPAVGGATSSSVARAGGRRHPLRRQSR